MSEQYIDSLFYLTIFTGISNFKFMSYITAANAVLILFLYVKCFSCVLFIVRCMIYLSWYFFLVVTVPLVTPFAVNLLFTFIFLVVPYTTDCL